MKKIVKKRGRPVTVDGPVTAIRLTPALSEAIEKWRLEQEEQPARSVAIRQLIMHGIEATRRKGARR